MNLRSALLTAAALAAAFCASLALGRWGAQGNGDPVSLAWEVQRGDELESHIEAGRRRAEAKRALAAEVVAGRLSLREAAGHFRRLNDAASDHPASFPRPSGRERALRHEVLDWVWVALSHQQQYAAAARWYAEAFVAHPDLLPGPPTGHRYYAARAAVLAGCGKGRDAAGLDARSGARFRRQALAWLRDELEAERRLLATEPGETRWFMLVGLQRWLWDPDFAGVRGPNALARLSEPERQAWRRLWADVADTLARAEGTAAPEEGAGRKGQLPER
jgi:hypothetical protein